MKVPSRWKRAATTVVGASVLMLAVTGCGFAQAKTNASQCAYVIHKGYFDVAHIKDILLPGEKASKHGATSHYIYCNARNYLVDTGDAPDEATPISVRTASNNGDAGTQIKVALAVYWQVNQSHAALTEFLPFCEKYNCFSSPGDSSAAHASSAGWNVMLSENFAPTLQRAAVETVVNYDSNLPNEQNKWPALGDAIAKAFMTDVQITDGQEKASGGDGINFFCASGSSTKTCQPVSVQVQSVEYVNSSAQALATQSATLAQQQAIAQQQLQQKDQLQQETAQVNTDTLAAAKDKYGDQAPQVLGDLDIIAACKDAGSTCVITLGDGPSTGVTVPVK